MITKTQFENARIRALGYFAAAGIFLTDEDKARIEVADFGLSDLENIGLEILTYVNTERVCAKELILFPFQTCPEHRHIGSDKGPGKEETFRCRRGVVYLYVPGEKTKNPKARPINSTLTVFREIVLNPGEQYTLMPDTLHWFQAGPEGAVVSEFSSRSSDETDIFTDTNVLRSTVVNDACP